MEFVFDTVYDQKAVTAMAKALRKTVRKKRSRRSHIFGWILLGVILLLTLPFGNEHYKIEFRTVVTWLAGAVILIALIWEDRLNGWIARKRMLAGTDRAKSVFTEEGYFSETPMGNTQWRYENIKGIAEMKRYFVFIFSQNHAQVYDKKSLTGGTAEEFRAFIVEQTGKEVLQVK